MDFLNDLKERAADLAQVGAELAQAGVAKSRQLAEIGRLNVNNAAEEAAIRKAYAEIGRLYYAERGMAPDAAYQALCEKITASKVTIEENKARISELKEAGGVTDEERRRVSSAFRKKDQGMRSLVLFSFKPALRFSAGTATAPGQSAQWPPRRRGSLAPAE